MFVRAPHRGAALHHSPDQAPGNFCRSGGVAIENVRLLQELEARTRELVRSVDELKALGEVGQAVSSTLDLETVLTRSFLTRFN